VTKARVPHVALVVLPALALAAVGVRAVTAEMRASEDAARERARSVASRLARSVDALVAEYAGALPKPGTSLTREQAKEMTAHLQPRRALTLDGVSLALDHDLPPDPGPIPEREASLVEDALARGNALAQAPNGYVAAAALEMATATAVEHPVARAQLLFAALDHDHALAGEHRASDLLHEAIALGAFRRGPDGVPFDLRAVRLAAATVGDSIGSDGALQRAYERVAEDPWGLDDNVRDGVLNDADRAPPGSLIMSMPPTSPWTPWYTSRAGGDAARDLAHRLTNGEPPPSAVLSSRRLRVWTNVTVDGRRVVLGGDVPALVVGGFGVGAEAAALVREPGVQSVRLASSDGTEFWSERGAGDAHDVVVETVPLADPLSTWRAEAVVARESGIPPTAWLLGAAVVVTTAALVAGMLALRRSAERSARLAEDRQTFLDHVAHELRTPAAAVQALTEELASGHVTKEREPVYREHLLRESRRLSALVEDTLDLTRLDAGRLAFKMEPADLRDVVRRAVEESDGAGRVVATLPDAPVVRAVDEGTLRRAVRNLVENALRHGGGTAPVRVTLEASNGAASIAVADEGRGIAKEHLPRLFERFYRVPSPTHETKGVGLGLALCREVARAHGGDVTVASEVDKGSTFTLRIPLGDALHFQLSRSDAPRPPDATGKVEREERPRRSDA
jgi:signal transduction histidine kinase